MKSSSKFSGHGVTGQLNTILCSFFCLLAGGLLLADRASGQNTNESKFELFKKYLEERPEIEKVLFSKRQIPNALVPNQQGQTQSKPGDAPAEHLLYHGAWKSNAFFIHEIRDSQSSDNWTNNLFLAGINKDIFWTEDSNNTLVSIYSSISNTNNQRSNNTFAVCLTAEATLFQGINLGLVFEPRSLKWRNNDFTASFFDPLAKTRSMVVGELKVENDLPTEIRCRIQGFPGLFLIEYKYTTNVGLAYLPNKFDLTVYDADSNAIPVTEYELLNLTIATREIPDEYFGPAHFVVSNVTKSITYSNGIRYQLFDGQFGATPTQSCTGNRFKRATILIGLMFISTIAIIFSVLKSQQKKQIES